MNPLLLPQGAMSTPQNTTPLFNVPISTGRENAPAAVDFSSIPQTDVPQRRRQGRHDGIQGVARDILGTLGDFLLTRLHMPAMYAPAQHQRRLSEAFQGHEQDMAGAIDRVSDIDFAQGQRLREQNVDNQRLAATQASTAEAREARLQLQRDAANQRTHGVVAGLLNTLTGMSDEERRRSYPMIRDRARAAASQRGLTLTSDEVPDNYDPIVLDAYLNSNIPIGTQRQQLMTSKRNEVSADQGQQRIEQGNDRNAETRRNHDISDANNDANRASRDSNAAANRETRESIARRSDRTRRDIAGQRDRTANRGLDVRQRGQEINPRGRAVPRIPREGETRRVNGRIYVIRNGRPVPQ